MLGILLIRWKKDFSVGKVNLIVNIVLYSICLFLFDVETVIHSLIYKNDIAVTQATVFVKNIFPSFFMAIINSGMLKI